MEYEQANIYNQNTLSRVKKSLREANTSHKYVKYGHEIEYEVEQSASSSNCDQHESWNDF